MSIIRDGFRSLYRSGAFLTESLLPKALEKTGVPQGRAAKIGIGFGSVCGLASLVVGTCFLAALPMSLPMFSTAILVYAAKGVAMVAAMTATLAGTGIVVTTTGAGMCREMKKQAVQAWKKARSRLHKKSPSAPPAPQTSVFGDPKAAPGFKKAVDGAKPAAAPDAPKLPLAPSPQPG